jgi:hypothetical protein
MQVSFIDEARGESAFKPRVPCTLGRALGQLSEKQRADVQEALDDPECTAAAISRVLLRRHQVTVSQGSVQRHRKAECRCA